MEDNNAIALTMSDYENHKSFINKQESPHFTALLMKSDKDIFGNYTRLDNMIVPDEFYEIVFCKPINFNER